MNKSTCPPMRPNWLASASIIAMFVSGGVWADPVQVWVQPDGNTFATAYALQNEARTYFGRAECNACGALEYKWEFSDGTSTGFASVADPRYIEHAAKTFAAFGTQWAQLTVRETANPGNTGSAQIDLQVIASASDNLNRQKNSAIDRGLRRLYLREQGSSTGASYWNDDVYNSYQVGATGLALIAFENHGHNLQSADSNIYKKSVRQGVQWLLDHASQVGINNQRCIGNPDTNGNGKGVVIGNAYHIYEPSIALLALVNSADRTFAQSYVAATSNSVNGMTLFNIAVDATDWMAWAQSDGDTGGTSGSAYCSAGDGFYINYSGSDITGANGGLYSDDIASFGGCGGDFTFDWGDGTSSSYADEEYYCDYNGPNTAYVSLNWVTSTPVNHTYTTGGDYTVSLSYTGNTGPVTTALCNVSIPITVSNATGCSATDAESGAGGWSYGPNEARGDNSLTQWAVLGISEAKARWNIDVNPGVISQLGHWLDWSKCADGTFGYDGPGSWCNYQKVGAGLIMLKYVGRPLSDTTVQNALTYAQNNWTSTYEGNLGNLYSMYGLYKAMKVWGMTDLGSTTNTGMDWEDQYAQNLISNQNADGSWGNLGGWMYPSTAAAVAILAPEVASLPPVANAGGPYAPIAPNQMLQLNGANSYHQDPAKTLVLWQWDFNASNGMWWDTLPAPAAGEGGVGINPSVSYGDAGQDAAYTVTLRVTDNTSPTPMRATNTTVVNVTSGNVAPVAITNGPWSAVPNAPIIFDASASYDPNACSDSGNPTCLSDSIVMYEWDLDGDGLFNGAGDGTPVTPDRKQVQQSYPNPISLPAKLRVTDEHGLTGVTTDALNVVSVALVYGQHYETCFRVSLNRFEDRIGLRIKFKNLGNAEAENVEMTLSSVPSNMTIVEATANLGDIPAGAEVLTACDATAKTADIELRTNRRIAPTGGWSWNADFDLLGNHYHVTNLPPLN
jgi:hypothetical protein